MKRRLFLKGAGGAALAAPFLGSLRDSAHAQAAQSPRRLVFFHTGGGCLTTRWFPKVEHGVLTASALAGDTLEPLTPYVDKLLFPRGLAMFPYGNVVVDGTAYFDPHGQAMGSKLTAAPIDPFGAHWALGRSLDHVVADHINPAGRAPLVLSVGKTFVDARTILSYTGPREPVTPLDDPSAVYRLLTGVDLGSDEPTEADYRVRRGESIIDAVRDDLETLRRSDLSQQDQHKIDAWLELLRAGELDTTEYCRTAAAMKLELTEEAILAVDPADQAIAFTLGSEALMKLVTLAMACDLNRSIVLQWASFVTFQWDGIHHTHDHDSIAHRTGSAAVGGPCLEGVLEMIAEIDAWYAGRYARLLELIDGIPEGEHTLLDNSAVVWLPEFSDGGDQNVNNLPIVIAGGAGGYLRQGESVNVAGEVLGAGNSEGRCTGSSSDSGDYFPDTGSDTGHVPLNKLYVTLLNAVGARDGDEPFSEFGLVDTNDVEAGITSPGELAELRA